ncbi:MAG TPA: xanthine dehydrogenase family protein subunit M [Gemmataceae bacterium]|nr:xanthine dehydrogenase family protein subunit M [Gemmataceae bacterium]
MKNFTYYRPTTVKQAVGLLDDKWGRTELLAGGTDLLDLQKQYVAQPEKVVSLGGLERSGIRMAGGNEGGLAIGAATTLAEIAEAEAVRKAFPALAEAAGRIGGAQIRNMGTLGGNLCQRNRCWYFRDEHVQCLLKGGPKCYALDGENEYHAVFTQGHKCVIVNPSTLAPVLIALDATADVVGPKGQRTISLAKFFHAPSSATEREHVLEPNDIVTRVVIPQSASGKNASYQVNHKESHDWPLVQAAVAYKDDNGKAKDVKIVLGQVAPTPHIASAAAQAIEGKEVSEGNATAAGKAAAEGAKPLAKNGYKVQLIEVAVKRALLTAAGQKPYWES